MSMTTELPSKLSGKLTPEELAVWGGRWYHNFSPLGLPAGKQTEVQLQHQLEKQGDIFRHVRDAFLRLKKDPKGLQLTSTDGLFGLYAAMKGASHVDIVNVTPGSPASDRRFMEQTRIAAKLLDLEKKVDLSSGDVFKISGPYDFCISTGCLYNLPEPGLVLTKLRDIVNGPLIIHEHTWLLPSYTRRFREVRMGQLEREIRFMKDTLSRSEIEERKTELKEWKSGKDDLHFQSPAEYREWGSRFSHDSLIVMAVDAGWTVINEKVAEVPPLNWLDRGSSSLLCI